MAMVDTKWLDRQVQSFKQNRPLYERFAAVLQTVFEQAVQSMGIIARVQVRAKTVPSFAEKCVRKKYRDPMHQMTDLCGARVIVESQDQVDG